MKMILKFWFRRTVVGLLAVLALRALGQAPTVISVTPANNATGVATNVTMVIRFSTAMDAESFIPSFHLTFQPTGPFSSAEWNDDNTEVSLPIFLGGFAGGTKYTWTLTPVGRFRDCPSSPARRACRSWRPVVVLRRAAPVVEALPWVTPVPSPINSIRRSLR